MKPPHAAFIHPDFLLETTTAQRLYHEVAEPLPIIDYHCHLAPQDIARNRQFTNLTEIWLEGDHYKWRALRANGIAESLITGTASPRQKFQAWAETMPMTWRNPLFHWSHLELARTFGIFELLDGDSAEAVWLQTSQQLTGVNAAEFSAHGILAKMRVEVVCTTDDPTDTLEHHLAINSSALSTKILPTFRPDKAMAIENGAEWNAWVDLLAVRSEYSLHDATDFFAALKQRHDFFGKLGGRLSDHGLAYCPALEATDQEINIIFLAARAGKPISSIEAEKFATRILVEVGRWNHEKNWTMQLHLGALRNNSSRNFNKLGRDTGFDSIGDRPQADRLSWLLNQLDQEDQLPRTILYNLNPADNYVFASMAGNFNDGALIAKVQTGSGWWFLDQKEAMEWQLNSLSNLGLISRFTGMTTDSRSFLSYPRHEYFRRILCNLLGRDVEAGVIPNQPQRLAHYVKAICYGNARDYFQF